MSSSFKSIHIFGVTGSIGQSASDVILKHADKFSVHTVSANVNAKKLAQSAIELKAKKAVLVDATQEDALRAALEGHDIEIACGEAALIDAAKEPVDMVLAAIVGMAGLESLWEAIKVSACVAIANKEPLVAAGHLVMDHAKAHNCTILPVDSEHNAIFQVFDFDRREHVERIILTASGGPFRTWSIDDMARATVEQAVAHPNWSMGQKISVDSATMMNKALELIEAHYLFDVPADKIDVVIHPQSVIHSMVEYNDGSFLAQMGASDMCTPLANVMFWPERLATPGAKLDLMACADLQFEAVDHEQFPFLSMAYDALSAGPYACLAMNAANEVAVEAFLQRRIGFSDIMACVAHVVGIADKKALPSLADLLSYDDYIRDEAQAFIQKHEQSQVA